MMGSEMGWSRCVYLMQLDVRAGSLVDAGYLWF